MTTATPVDARAQQIADLRAAVDWLEAHPDVPLGTLSLTFDITGDGGAAAFCCDNDVIVGRLSLGTAMLRRGFGSVSVSAFVSPSLVMVPEAPAPEFLTPAEIRERAA